MKMCSKCKETKPLDKFSKDAQKRDGLCCQCKVCQRAMKDAYLAANPDKVKAEKAAYYAANLERFREANKAWKLANLSSVQEMNKAWRKKNADHLRESKKSYSAKNIERLREQYKAWRLANPDKRRINQQNRRARKKQSSGKLSHGLASKLFKLQGGKCPCCKQPLGANYHLDHIMPLALGGANKDGNMQLLRATCNMQKSDQHPLAFMQLRGFLI